MAMNLDSLHWLFAWVALLRQGGRNPSTQAQERRQELTACVEAIRSSDHAAVMGDRQGLARLAQWDLPGLLLSAIDLASPGGAKLLEVEVALCQRLLQALPSSSSTLLPALLPILSLAVSTAQRVPGSPESPIQHLTAQLTDLFKPGWVLGNAQLLRQLTHSSQLALYLVQHHCRAATCSAAPLASKATAGVLAVCAASARTGPGETVFAGDVLDTVHSARKLEAHCLECFKLGLLLGGGPGGSIALTSIEWPLWALQQAVKTQHCLASTQHSRSNPEQWQGRLKRCLERAAAVGEVFSRLVAVGSSLRSTSGGGGPAAAVSSLAYALSEVTRQMVSHLEEQGSSPSFGDPWMRALGERAARALLELAQWQQATRSDGARATLAAVVSLTEFMLQQPTAELQKESKLSTAVAASVAMTMPSKACSPKPDIPSRHPGSESSCEFRLGRVTVGTPNVSCPLPDPKPAAGLWPGALPLLPRHWTSPQLTPATPAAIAHRSSTPVMGSVASSTKSTGESSYAVDAALALASCSAVAVSNKPMIIHPAAVAQTSSQAASVPTVASPPRLLRRMQPAGVVTGSLQPKSTNHVELCRRSLSKASASQSEPAVHQAGASQTRAIGAIGAGAAIHPENQAPKSNRMAAAALAPPSKGSLPASRLAAAAAAALPHSRRSRSSTPYVVLLKPGMEGGRGVPLSPAASQNSTRDPFILASQPGGPVDRGEGRVVREPAAASRRQSAGGDPAASRARVVSIGHGSRHRRRGGRKSAAGAARSALSGSRTETGEERGSEVACEEKAMQAASSRLPFQPLSSSAFEADMPVPITLPESVQQEIAALRGILSQYL